MLLGCQQGGAKQGSAAEEWVRLRRWGSTLCQPFPSPSFLSDISCLPTASSSLTPSRLLSTGDGRRALSFFHQKGLQDFDALLLSDDGGTLYVGTREAILALNIEGPGVPRLKNMVRARERVRAGSEEGADSCPVPGLPTSE